MTNIKSLAVFILLAISFSSCEAIGNIFSAGVWIGMTIVVIVIIILFAVFRKKS